MLSYDFKDSAAFQSYSTMDVYNYLLRWLFSTSPVNLGIHPVSSTCSRATAETTASELFSVVSEGAERHWCPEWPHLQDASEKHQLFQKPDANATGSCMDHVRHIL